MKSEEEMWRLAHELADSGKYLSSAELVMELKTRGFSDTEPLWREPVRSELTRRCLAARKAG